MTVMAILQEVDKCMRCNGCVIACKREWKMKQDTVGVNKVAYDQRLAIKSQKRVDMGPFVRYTCWHCPDPPCAGRCPTKADHQGADGCCLHRLHLCDPSVCVNAFGQYPCQVDCQRGGYPKIGVGSDLPAAAGQAKSHKCTLCHTRAGADVSWRGCPADPAGQGRERQLQRARSAATSSPSSLTSRHASPAAPRRP